jgi:hypothetical protein
MKDCEHGPRRPETKKARRQVGQRARRTCGWKDITAEIKKVRGPERDKGQKAQKPVDRKSRRPKCQRAEWPEEWKVWGHKGQRSQNTEKRKDKVPEDQRAE